MKNIVITFLYLFCLTNCVRHVPLHGKYPQGPVYGESEKSPEMVWQKLIDVVTDNGLDLKFIDKSSGFVMSDELSFYREQTVENTKGKLVNPEAYIVTSRTDAIQPEFFRISKLTAKWSVVLRPSAKGGTQIKAVLSNIEAKDELVAAKTASSKSATRYEARSLLNFEKWLIDALK